MSPDDPRHGSHAGYAQHRHSGVEPCQPCRDAAARYQRGREWDTLNGRPRTVPTTGFRRRIEALQSLGWSITHIANELGTTVQTIHTTAFKGTCVRAWRHDQLAALYERLSMTHATDRLANRRRTIAARKGYAPPLAWDDIDTDPAPHGLTETPRDLLAEYDFLTRCGESHEQAIRQLGVTAGAIERAVARRTQRAEREAA